MNPTNDMLLVVAVVVLAVGLVTLAIGIRLILRNRRAEAGVPVAEPPQQGRQDEEAPQDALRQLLTSDQRRAATPAEKPMPVGERGSVCDPLTGLYNCKTGQNMVEAVLEASDEGATHALLSLNLDDFSHILYMMGDDIGDILLREVAKVLWAQLRVGDIVMRLENADEFLVMLPNIDPERAVLVAQRLCDRITELSDGGKLGLETTASIGIALYPQHGTDFDSLYDSAAQAMGCSKKAGKNRCQLFGTEDLFTPLQG